MKKFFTLLVSCSLPAMLAAQSTCETRVDAHQKATTTQRVAYCLTPDEVVETDYTYANLVYSGVSSHTPQDAKPAVVKPTAKAGYFKPERVAVDRSYVGTGHFPQLPQGPSTDQPFAVVEHQMVDEVVVSQPAAPVRTYTAVPGAVEHFMIDEVDAQGRLVQPVQTVQTASGLKARQTKPARRWMAALPQTEPEPVAPAADQAQTTPALPQTQPDTVEPAPVVPSGEMQDMNGLELQPLPAAAQSEVPTTSN